MKKTRWMSFLLVLMIAAVFVVGCPEDDDDDNNPVGPGAGDITGDEMTEAQVTEVAETAMKGNAQTSIAMTRGLRQAFMNGVIQSVNPIDLKEIKSYQILAAPPEGWTGPDNDGWYTCTDVMEGEVFKVRLTPDIWSDEHAGEDLTKIEYHEEIVYDYMGMVITYTHDYWAEVNGDPTKINGGIDITVGTVMEYGGQDISYTSTVSYTFTDVSLVEGDYSGSFTSTMSYPMVDAMGGILMVAITTQLDFNADGTGTGTGSIAGEEYVRFTFTDANAYEIVGYYTLKSEDWEIEHPITMYLY